jgi:peptide deformylase
MKVSEHLLQDSIKEESDALRYILPDVNIRLFTSNEPYRKIVLHAIEYLEWHLKCIFEDATGVKGVSGAIVGIPWNIIAYKDQSNTTRVCINPKIINESNTKITTKTSCGSFITKDNVYVKRCSTIDLEFHDINGQKVLQKGITKDMGGYSIQHEVEHNQGICIVDKQEKAPSYGNNWGLASPR